MTDITKHVYKHVSYNENHQFFIDDNRKPYYRSKDNHNEMIRIKYENYEKDTVIYDKIMFDFDLENILNLE